MYTCTVYYTVPTYVCMMNIQCSMQDFAPEGSTLCGLHVYCTMLDRSVVVAIVLFLWSVVVGSLHVGVIKTLLSLTDTKGK